jgi:methionyl-tRNA formyltransferase
MTSDLAAPSKFRIAFLTGTDKVDLLRGLAARGEEIVQIILPFSCKREDRLLPVVAASKDLNIPICRPKRAELEAALRRQPLDILLSAGYPYLLSAAQLDVAAYNLNVHPTLLPRYRGPATAWHVIAHGEEETGVTVHRIDEGMDTGAILAQVRIPLTPFDTVRSMMRKTNEAELPAVEAALARIRRGDAVGTPQDETQTSAFIELRTPADSRIDPSRPLSELYNFIRACDSDRFPAFFEVSGESVGVRLFRLERKAGEEDML